MSQERRRRNSIHLIDAITLRTQRHNVALNVDRTLLSNLNPCLASESEDLEKRKKIILILKVIGQRGVV